MPRLPSRAFLPAAAALLLAAGAVSPGAGEGPRPWGQYGGDPRHTALSSVPAQPLQGIRWSAPVDLQPQYSEEGDLLIHYGTPLVTAGNTVVFPVKTGAAGGFRVEARRGGDGSLLWSLDTDYDLPAHGWIPSCGLCLDAEGRVCIPAAGGTLLRRSDPDLAEGVVERVAFFGRSAYEAAAASFDAAVRINTPITADGRGNLYFGFVADEGAPRGLRSGVARVSRSGRGRWRAAADAARDGSIRKVVHNGAPALDRRGRTLYLAVNDHPGSGYGAGWLLALDARSLAPRHRVRLKDLIDLDLDLYPDDAILADDGTSSPTVGPDGHVFFGVLSFTNHSRGWMLHFDRRLRPAGPPGGFGWDDTASVVPAEAVPGYAGPSEYLILTKYNDYVGAGGDGVHRLALLDPGDSMTDPISGFVTVMKEILTVAGPTPDDEYVGQGFPDAVREWCINTAAVDAEGRCAFVNNEDGALYRWDFASNTLSESLVLTAGVGEAYTPTVVGPDGTVYAINNAILFACGEEP